MKRVIGFMLCVLGFAGMLIPYGLLMSRGDIALALVAIGTTCASLGMFHAGVDLLNKE